MLYCSQRVLHFDSFILVVFSRWIWILYINEHINHWPPPPMFILSKVKTSRSDPDLVNKRQELNLCVFRDNPIPRGILQPWAAGG